MSVVTNFILTCSLAEAQYITDPGSERDRRIVPSVDVLNARLVERFGKGTTFKLLNDAFGGYKAPEALIFGLAGNYTTIGLVIAIVSDAPWDEPEHVRLFVQIRKRTRFSFATKAAVDILG